MAQMAQWLTKTWEISPNKIMALEGLSTAFKLKTDNNDDKEGKAATNVRGLELQTISFDTFLSDTVGIDVLTEIESWAELIGQSGTLTIGGKKFGPEKLLLTDASFADILVDDLGRIRQAKVSLNFKEDSEEANKTKPVAQKNKSTQNAPGIKKGKLTVTPVSSATQKQLGIGTASKIGANSADKGKLKSRSPSMK